MNTPQPSGEISLPDDDVMAIALKHCDAVKDARGRADYSFDNYGVLAFARAAILADRERSAGAVPFLYLSNQQAPAIAALAEKSSYIPFRLKPEGLFTIPLYTAPQPSTEAPGGAAEGWQLVPKRATAEMLMRAMNDCGGIGGGSCGEHQGVDWDDFRAVYESMLSAAPRLEVPADSTQGEQSHG